METQSRKTNLVTRREVSRRSAAEYWISITTDTARCFNDSLALLRALGLEHHDVALGTIGAGVEQPVLVGGGAVCVLSPSQRPITLLTENGGNTKLRPSNGWVECASTCSEVTLVPSDGAWRDSMVPLPMPG